MKIIITMMLSASFIAASTVITAEEGLMKAVAKNDKSPQPIINVQASKPSMQVKHIRELHGELRRAPSARSMSAKRDRRLAEFKEQLKKQRQARLLGLGSPSVTKIY